MRIQAPRMTWQRAFSVVLACSLLGLAGLGLIGCRSDRVSVNTKDSNSPQFAYRLDELALLRMSADDILEMERKKQYGQIYDEYASDAFKNAISRRRFLIMSNCVETYLGAMEEFDPNELGFRRDTAKGKNKTGDAFLDVLNRKVQRIQGTIEEQLVFVPSGLSFKLNGMYWIAKDKQFHQCIAESPQVEASTKPVPETPPGEAGKTPEQSTTTQTPTGEPQNAETPKAGETGSTATTEPAKTGTEGTPSAETPPPVQEMKPAEIRKQPLEARPAGAGAVIDQRPVPKKVRKAPQVQTGASSEEKKQTGAPIPGSSGGSAEKTDAQQPPIPDSSDENRH